MDKKVINVDLTCPPSAMHAGFVLAKAKGYFDREGIKVNLCSAKSEEMSVKDDIKEAVDELMHHKVDVAILPSNALIYCHTRSESKESKDLVAIATLYQKDFTGIGYCKKVNGRSDINSPKDLDGKKVASFGLHFSEEMIRELIKADGGKGEPKEVTVALVKEMLPGLKEGKWDAGKIWVPYHVVKAKKEGMQDFNVFKWDDFGIPNGYRALLVTRKKMMQQNEKKEMMKCFMRAIKKGYEDMMKEDPEQIAKMLRDEFPSSSDLKDTEFLKESIKCAREYLVMEEQRMMWGKMNEEVWKKFVEFLADKKILADENGVPIRKDSFDVKSLFTNEMISE